MFILNVVFEYKKCVSINVCSLRVNETTHFWCNWVIKWEMDRTAGRISQKKGDWKESEWNILGVGWRAG